MRNESDSTKKVRREADLFLHQAPAAIVLVTKIQTFLHTGAQDAGNKVRSCAWGLYSPLLDYGQGNEGMRCVSAEMLQKYCENLISVLPYRKSRRK